MLSDCPTWPPLYSTHILPRILSHILLIFFLVFYLYSSSYSTHILPHILLIFVLVFYHIFYFIIIFYIQALLIYLFENNLIMILIIIMIIYNYKKKYEFEIIWFKIELCLIELSNSHSWTMHKRSVIYEEYKILKDVLVSHSWRKEVLSSRGQFAESSFHKRSNYNSKPGSSNLGCVICPSLKLLVFHHQDIFSRF